jgi:hypothetical protein
MAEISISHTCDDSNVSTAFHGCLAVAKPNVFSSGEQTKPLRMRPANYLKECV